MIDNCYNIETLHFDNPAFKKVGLTVLITMEDSNRRNQYMQELSQNRPTEKVVILHNKGFKKCPKKGVSSTIQDLWHANQKAISLSENELPILILEDDVEFLSNFRKYATQIEEFFTMKRGACSYNLGSHVLLSVPSSKSHIRVLLGGMNQAVLYNAKALQIMKSVKIGIVPHDLVLTRKIKTYVFKKALTFQKLIKTANSKAWNIGGIPLLIQKDMIGLGSSKKSFENSHFIASFGGMLPYMIGIILVLLYKMEYTKKLHSR